MNLACSSSLKSDSDERLSHRGYLIQASEPIPGVCGRGRHKSSQCILTAPFVLTFCDFKRIFCVLIYRNIADFFHLFSARDIDMYMPI